LYGRGGKAVEEVFGRNSELGAEGREPSQLREEEEFWLEERADGPDPNLEPVEGPSRALN